MNLQFLITLTLHNFADESSLKKDNLWMVTELKASHELMRFRRAGKTGSRADPVAQTFNYSISASRSPVTLGGIEKCGKGVAGGSGGSFGGAGSSRGKGNRGDGKGDDEGAGGSGSSPVARGSTGKPVGKNGRRGPVRSRSSTGVFGVSPYSRKGYRNVRVRSKSSTNAPCILEGDGVGDRKSANRGAKLSTPFSGTSSGSSVNGNGGGNGRVGLRSSSDTPRPLDRQ